MLIIDPTDSNIRSILKIVESFVIHATPIRTGIVFKVDPSKDVTGLNNAGVAMLCAFNYVQQTQDPPSAYSFIRSVMSSSEGDQVLTAYFYTYCQSYFICFVRLLWKMSKRS